MKTFISYKHGSEKHQQWVAKLASDIESAGIPCLLDQFHLKPGDSISDHMKKITTETKVFLFIVTPESVRALEQNQGNLTFEMQLAVTLKNKGKLKIIPIIKKGQKVPLHLLDYLYLDFRVDDKYNESLKRLIDAIKGPQTEVEDISNSKIVEPPLSTWFNSMPRLVAELGAIFRTPYTSDELLDWFPTASNHDFAVDKSENHSAPEALKSHLLTMLQVSSATNEEAEEIAWTLLKMQKWIEPMEKPLQALIFEESLTKRDVISIIMRLGKLSGDDGIQLLKNIVCNKPPEFNSDFRYIALAALIKRGYGNSLDSTCLKGIDRTIIDPTMAYAHNSEEAKLWPADVVQDFRRKLNDIYTGISGHLIHKLKAKDTTGRWAYYFVLVPEKNEDSFLKAIEGDGTIDLEDYGKVVASSYGETPTAEVKNYLKEKYGFDV